MALDYAHNPWLVIASFAIALMAGFTGLSMARGLSKVPPAQRKLRVAMAALALGGGIWSMHFVAMLGLQSPDPVLLRPARDADLGASRHPRRGPRPHRAPLPPPHARDDHARGSHRRHGHPRHALHRDGGDGGLPRRIHGRRHPPRRHHLARARHARRMGRLRRTDAPQRPPRHALLRHRRGGAPLHRHLEHTLCRKCPSPTSPSASATRPSRWSSPSPPSSYAAPSSSPARPSSPTRPMQPSPPPLPRPTGRPSRRAGTCRTAPPLPHSLRTRRTHPLRRARLNRGHPRRRPLHDPLPRGREGALPVVDLGGRKAPSKAPPSSGSTAATS